LIEFRIHGRGGQGNVVAAYSLATAAIDEGRYGQTFPAFGAERRGAPVVAFVRIADQAFKRHCQVLHPAFLIIQDQALEEGVTIHTHRGIRRLILRGEHVVGVEMVHMKKLPNAQGTMERVAFEGTETVLHVDQVIPAIGQVVNPAGVEILLSGKHHLDVNHWGHIPNQPGVYTGGDTSRGGKGSVTAEVGDGRRAAEAIARQLQGKPVADPVDFQTLPYEHLNLHYYEHAPRNEHTT